MIAGACQSVFYWASGAVNIVVDKPDDPLAGRRLPSPRPSARETGAARDCCRQLPYRSDERFRREHAGDRHNVGITGRCDNAPRLEFAIIAGHDDVVSLPQLNQHLITECDQYRLQRSADQNPPARSRVSDVDVRAWDKLGSGRVDAEARDWVFLPSMTTCIH